MTNILTIEVRGIGFPNKGAELMLLAICDQIQTRYPTARICLQPNLPFKYRMQYPVYQIGRVVRFGIDFGRLLYLLPKKVRNMFGIIMPGEVNVILDASGFAYGDQWGLDKARMWLAWHIRRFKQNSNNRVIMLPQAFGPFSDPTLCKHMREIIEHTDVIFARDPSSFEHMQGLKEARNIHLAPDFTNLYKINTDCFDFLKQYPVCVIPNAKMVEMKSTDNTNSYIEFMVALIKNAHEANQSPYILIHEGQKDLALAQKIKSLAGFDLPIVQPNSAEKVKQAIAVSKLVVSSRFHGLVSALSQNIPVIATGWSHKYHALLKDYDVEDCIFDEDSGTDDAVKKMLNILNSEQEYQRISKLISDRGAEEKSKTQAMWQRVFSILDKVSGK